MRMVIKKKENEERTMIKELRLKLKGCTDQNLPPKVDKRIAFLLSPDRNTFMFIKRIERQPQKLTKAFFFNLENGCNSCIFKLFFTNWMGQRYIVAFLIFITLFK
jgi:hypothetical protein